MAQVTKYQHALWRLSSAASSRAKRFQGCSEPFKQYSYKFAQSWLTQRAEVKERTALSCHQLRITKIHSQLTIPDMTCKQGRTCGRDLKKSGSQLLVSPSI